MREREKRIQLFIDEELRAYERALTLRKQECKCSSSGFVVRNPIKPEEILDQTPYLNHTLPLNSTEELIRLNDDLKNDKYMKYMVSI